MKNTCDICSNIEANRKHTVREMAFGLRESFTYLECAQCGCLQLLEIPPNMAKYYPANYYSLQHHGKLKTFIRRRWANQAFGHKNWLGQFFSKAFFPYRAIQAVRRVAPQKTARILDIGCGRGRLLLDLAYLGFTDLTGVDPFIENDLTYENGVKVLKKKLTEISGKFDLIMLHHSFEHMDQPEETLRQVVDHLNPSGHVILSIPIASSYAWKYYGVNWVNLDAPRHLFLHTYTSVELLARKTGLIIKQIVQEGTGEQFWISEQYTRDIPSNDPRSISSSLLKRFLAWREIGDCQARAEKLNQKQEGDLVCFHMCRDGV